MYIPCFCHKNVKYVLVLTILFFCVILYINRNKREINMEDVRLKILPPWVIYIKKIEALFDGDPQIACNVNY